MSRFRKNKSGIGEGSDLLFVVACWITFGLFAWAILFGVLCVWLGNCV